MELEVTWGRTVRVWWAYAWRNLVVIVVSMILGFIFGGIIGFILGVAGVPIETIVAITTPLGFVIGIALSIIPMRMILGKDFGTFRLVLVATRPTEGAPAVADSSRLPLG